MFRSIPLACLIAAVCLVTVPSLPSDADAQVITTNQKILGRQLSCLQKGTRLIPGIMRKARFVRWRKVFKRRIAKLTNLERIKKAERLRRKLNSRRYRRKLKKRCKDADEQPQPTSSPTADPTSSPSGTPTAGPTSSPTATPTTPPPPGTSIFVDLALAPANGGSGDCAGDYDPALRACGGGQFVAFDIPQEAADIVNPGDTVYFREGTYYNHQQSAARFPVLHVLRSGTVNQPITFKNYNNEQVIMSGLDPQGNPYKYRTVMLGNAASDQQDISGQGVNNIVVEGLIVEGAASVGLQVNGPANRYASAQNPTRNVTIRGVIARNNYGGISTRGKVINVTIENCEAYNNTGTGIFFGRISKSWHLPEPEDDMSAAQHSTIRNCLAYNNSHPTKPGDTDGIAGSHMYRCTIENNVVFGNSDDGIDLYASLEVTARANIIFSHNNPGGNGAGLKFSAGGGGRHTIAGNAIFHNDGYSMESSQPSNPLRTYYPSRIYANLGFDGYIGISHSGTYTTTFPGYDQVVIRNNLLLENTNRDVHGISSIYTNSDYNFISNSNCLQQLQNIGQDAHSLGGTPGLVNKDATINTSFPNNLTHAEKLKFIRDQVKNAFSPASGSQLIDQGILIAGVHCASPGANPNGNCQEWYGAAPDIGPFDYAGN